jgi:hypothetical protein
MRVQRGDRRQIIKLCTTFLFRCLAAIPHTEAKRKKWAIEPLRRRSPSGK